MGITKDEVKELYLKKLGKSFEELTVFEKAVLVTVIRDALCGRYSKFFDVVYFRA